jgi:hypothetical protein
MKAFCLAGILCLLTVPAAAQSPVTAPQRVLPLDPLTPEERTVGEEIARANDRVREFLAKGRSQLIYVEFIAVKRDGAQAEPSGRFADVLFYRYDDDAGLRVLVDLGARIVADIVPVPGHSVPLTFDEVQEAARLALASGEVARLLGDNAGSFRPARGPATREQMNENRIEGLRTLGSTPDDPCTRDRCVVLFFRTRNRYIAMNRVVVDLTTNRVMVNNGAQP